MVEWMQEINFKLEGWFSSITIFNHYSVFRSICYFSTRYDEQVFSPDFLHSILMSLALLETVAKDFQQYCLMILQWGFQLVALHPETINKCGNMKWLSIIDKICDKYIVVFHILNELFCSLLARVFNNPWSNLKAETGFKFSSYVSDCCYVSNRGKIHFITYLLQKNEKMCFAIGMYLLIAWCIFHFYPKISWFSHL